MILIKKKIIIGSPVEAATAPISVDGIAAKRTNPAAIKQMSLAVDMELEDSVLWWKSWVARLPMLCSKRENVQSTPGTWLPTGVAAMVCQRKGLMEQTQKF